MDKELFDLAIRASEDIIEKNSSIGTKFELGVHLTLKYYIQPDMSNHEIKRAGFICDAVDDDGVFEIQTASFDKLKPKLKVLLNEGRFTVIYPVLRYKIISSADSETGLVSERKSPKRAGKYSVFAELSKISGFVSHKNFALRLIALGVKEYRIKYSGKLQDGKKGRWGKNYKKLKRVPVEIFEDTTLSSLEDYLEFIPEGLEEVFFSSDFARCAKIKKREASAALKFLSDVGILERIGRSKQGFLYARADDFVKNTNA